MRATILIWLLLAAGLFGAAGDSLLRYADYLFESRHLRNDSLAECRRLLDSLVALDSADSQALWRLGRYYYEAGTVLKVKKVRLSNLYQARTLLERSVRLNETDHEAHFFLGATLGRIGQVRGKMKSLFLIKSIKHSFRRSLELDCRYVRTLGGLGTLYDELPGLVGGNQAKAISYFDQAIAIDSNYTYAYVALSRIYVSEDREEPARSLLMRVVSTSNPTYPADYWLQDRPAAILMLEAMKDNP